MILFCTGAGRKSTPVANPSRINEIAPLPGGLLQTVFALLPLMPTRTCWPLMPTICHGDVVADLERLADAARENENWYRPLQGSSKD